MNSFNLLDLNGYFVFSTPNNNSDLNKLTVYLTQVNKEKVFGILCSNEIVSNHLYNFLKNTIFEESNIYHGGICDPQRLFIIHSSECAKSDSVKISPNVYISNFETLSKLDKLPEQYKIVSGYVYWKFSDLEKELNCGYWLFQKLDIHSIFEEQIDLWDFCIKNNNINPMNFFLSNQEC